MTLNEELTALATTLRRPIGANDQLLQQVDDLSRILERGGEARLEIVRGGQQLTQQGVWSNRSTEATAA